MPQAPFLAIYSQPQEKQRIIVRFLLLSTLDTMGLCIPFTGMACFPPASSSFVICLASECVSMPFAVRFSLLGRREMLDWYRPDGLYEMLCLLSFLCYNNFR